MKRAPRPDPAAGEAVRLGEILRDARMTLGYSLEDVAASLRIRQVYLLALEEGRVNDLPAPAYVLGFVRSYARVLGLDEDEMVRCFRDSASAAAPRRVKLIFPEPVPERGIPAGAMVMAGVVLAIGAYTAWFQWSGSGVRTVDTVPPMPARLEQLARETGPAPAEELAPLAERPPPGPPAASAATAPTQPAAPQPAPAPPTLARADESRILLRIKADTWVSLRERNSSQPLVARLMKAGETFAIPAREGLLLTTGFAAGLEFLVDGQPTPAFPATPSVRRDIPMEVERLKAGNFASLPTAAEATPPAATTPAATAPAAAPAAPAATTTAPAPAPRPARPPRPRNRAEEAPAETPR